MRSLPLTVSEPLEHPLRSLDGCQLSALSPSVHISTWIHPGSWFSHLCYLHGREGQNVLPETAPRRHSIGTATVALVGEKVQVALVLVVELWWQPFMWLSWKSARYKTLITHVWALLGDSCNKARSKAFIVDTHILLHTWACFRHVHYSVEEAAATLRDVQPVHGWSFHPPHLGSVDLQMSLQQVDMLNLSSNQFQRQKDGAKPRHESYNMKKTCQAVFSQQWSVATWAKDFEIWKSFNGEACKTN